MSEMKCASVFKSMLCCLKGDCEKCPCNDESELHGFAVNCLDILFDNATRIFEENYDALEDARDYIRRLEAGRKIRDEEIAEYQREVKQLQITIMKKNAEIERCKTEAENQSILWRDHFHSIFKSAKETARADAINEFAGMLKYTLCINNEENTDFFDYAYTLETIDKIAKEMKENNNGNFDL